MEDLVEETANQGWSDVKFREEQRQTGVTCLPQPQTLFILLIDTVVAQHALKQLHRGEERSVISTAKIWSQLKNNKSNDSACLTHL